MLRDGCPREAETIRAAWSDAPSANGDARRARPEIGDPDLLSHIAECQTCSEIAALAAALRQDRNEAYAKAHPPAAGAVWWRADRRAREEAARKAATPISLVHAVALGCAAAAAVAILGLGAGSVRDGLARWWTDFPWPTVGAGTVLGALSALPLGLLVLMGATLLLAPVALFLALSEK